MTVQQCLQSWQRRNPGYKIIALDHESITQHITLPAGLDLNRPDMTVQKISALSRLALLTRYGGVWADATVYCARPLDEWLPEHLHAGFFAFRDPGRDRMMSNWFIAAHTDNILLQRLQREFQNFFTDNLFSNQHTRTGELLLRIFNPLWSTRVTRSVYWHSLFARKLLRVYPYFIFHYTFNKLILEDAECVRIWNAARGLHAQDAHLLQQYQNEPGGSQKASRALAAGRSPVYKLDWRLDPGTSYWNEVLDLLR